jgi:hypothetical protein
MLYDKLTAAHNKLLAEQTPGQIRITRLMDNWKRKHGRINGILIQMTND